VPPLNLVGDFGGGRALYLVVGVLAALLEASEIRQGPSGRCRDVRRRAASLMSMFFDLAAARPLGRGGASRISSTAARISSTGIYECSCGHFISIGSIEPQFLCAAAPAWRA